jgi:hypothetical protein
MPNKAALSATALPAWVLALCLGGAVSVSAQAPDKEPEQEPEATVASDSEAPAIVTPTDSAEPPSSDAPTDPGAILDYEPTESISEDLSVSFPVDI